MVEAPNQAMARSAGETLYESAKLFGVCLGVGAAAFVAYKCFTKICCSKSSSTSARVEPIEMAEQPTKKQLSDVPEENESDLSPSDLHPPTVKERY